MEHDEFIVRGRGIKSLQFSLVHYTLPEGAAA